MPQPLTWDMQGVTWSPSFHWDGSLPSTKRKTMSTTKATIDFSTFTEAALSPAAQAIHDTIAANAATFPALPVTLVALQGLITTYDQKLAAKASGAKADTVAFHEAREDLEEALGTPGNYVNGVAKGSPVIVSKSGFPSYETGNPPNTAPPAAPTNVRLEALEVEGSFKARFKPDRTPSANEVQVNLGDPNDEAAWKPRGIFLGGRAELEGFPPGTVVWFRVRTAGLKGVMGAWSDPAKVRVL